ncbi:uncharacterized protein LOC121255327 [Juglans microcarpa x Juglans regia]|uniref:uncharacterized protein LOC121255327 n=1 Tax=Juglans microcarpa x Juglans regia TaxID=2249226 RepID=UPI001B7EB71F|nr:uncharacterized protein LOC121255327 [Juglans microcarpa x Juglans regia]
MGLFGSNYEENGIWAKTGGFDDAEWRNVADILDQYRAASGQSLNLQKTSMLNTKLDIKDQIVRELGARVSRDAEKYLGLPSMVGKSKSKAFREIKEKVWSKLQNWKNNFLRQAGKEIFTKAVIQAILTYTMSVFKLPKKLCKEISDIMVRFW